MLERDYILRLLNKFFENLSLYLDRKRKGEEDQIETFYTNYFHPSKFYIDNTKEEVLNSLSEYPKDEEEYRMEMLAELLCQDALERKEESVKVNLLKKSLFLYERLDTLSSTYSFERKRKIQEIQGIIDFCIATRQ
jgi:hypothetical protein